MDKQLKHLIDILREAELVREADELNYLLIKAASTVENNLFAWQAVIDELDRPADLQLPDRAVQYLVEAARNLVAAEPLQKLSPEEINESAERIGTIMSRSKMNPDQFFVKNAGIMSMLDKAAPLFSFIVALKNIYYGFQEFKKVQASAGYVELNWMDTLQPSKLTIKAREFQNAPDDLVEIVKLSKSGMIMWDEGISLIVNLIDGFKDVMLTIPTVISYIGTMGVAGLALTAIDFSISMLLWLAVESPAENLMREQYEPVFNLIRYTAQITIAALIEQQAPKPDDSTNLEVDTESEDYDFSAEKWWAAS